jgi:hypothetical protein
VSLKKDLVTAVKVPPALSHAPAVLPHCFQRAPPSPARVARCAATRDARRPLLPPRERPRPTFTPSHTHTHTHTHTNTHTQERDDMKEELAKVVKAHSDSVADKSSRETQLAQFKSGKEDAERQVH